MTTEQKNLLINTIKDLLADNQIEEAARELIQLDRSIKANIEDRVINRLGEYSDAQKAFDLDNTITRQEFVTSTNRVRLALLELCKIAQDFKLAEPPNAQPQRPVEPTEIPEPFNDKPNVKFALLYDQKDEASADQFNKHLTVLRLTGKIDVFAVHQSKADAPLIPLTEKAIEQAHYVLALISPNIFNNEAFWLGMMLQALEKGKKLIPIRLERTDLEGTGIEGVRGLPALGKTVSEYSNRELAFSEMVDEIKRLLAKN